MAVRWDRLAVAAAFLVTSVGLRFAAKILVFGADDVYTPPDSVLDSPRADELVDAHCIVTNVELMRRTPCGGGGSEPPCGPSILHYRMAMKLPNDSAKHIQSDEMSNGGNRAVILLQAHAWEELGAGDRGAALEQARYHFPRGTAIGCWYDPTSRSFRTALQDRSWMERRKIGAPLDLSRMVLVFINPLRPSRSQKLVYACLVGIFLVPCCFFMGLWLAFSAITGRNTCHFERLEQFSCDVRGARPRPKLGGSIL
jgi:hypothetical protein